MNRFFLFVFFLFLHSLIICYKVAKLFLVSLFSTDSKVSGLEWK